MRAFYSSLCIAFFSPELTKNKMRKKNVENKTATKGKYLIESIELHFILKYIFQRKSTFTDFFECNQQRMDSKHKRPCSIVKCKAHAISKSFDESTEMPCQTFDI